MHIPAVIAALFLLLQSSEAQNFANETIYLLTVTSQAVGGTSETLCVHVRPLQPSRRGLSLSVNLEFEQTHRTILTKKSIKDDYYQCVSFQVPEVSVETEASIGLQLKGEKTSVNKTTKILIRPRTQLVIIQTDKPIYKPGQTVKFRIVSLNSNFLTYNQKFPTIELQDPNSNRIGQWLNVSTPSGLVDLSYPTNTESPHGNYIITAWNQKNEPITQTFEISVYELPKFEVNVQSPPVITILDMSAAVKVCAKYTYGKPVNGSVKTGVCRNAYRYWWFGPDVSQSTDICKNFSVTTDATGCASHVLDLKDFALIRYNYEDTIRVNSEVEEYGTGVILKGSGSMAVTTEIVTVTFEDVPAAYKPGMNYNGKVKVVGPNSTPLKNKSVTLTIMYEDKNSERSLVTNSDGIAEFSLETEPWGQTSVSLQAYHQKTTDMYTGETRAPYYSTAYRWIQPFFSSSSSFVTLQRSSKPFSCTSNTGVRAQYLIQAKAFRAHQRTLAFFYMVMSKGTLAQQGTLSVRIIPGKENRGQVSFQLQKVQTLTPVAQVVIYALLPSGEVIGDSVDFPIELCLPNKVSLNFTSQTELPAANTTLSLTAAPGSLCSVRAIDQSLLLLRPETELSADYIAGLLPVPMISGYPYNVDDEYTYCPDVPLNDGILVRPRRKLFIPYSWGNDVYNVFKHIGVKILTNAIVRKPVKCYRPVPFLREPAMGMAGGMDGPALAADNGGDGGEFRVSAKVAPITTVRKFFPETWIFDLVPVSKSGTKNITKTVPDSITTWVAEAFCLSSIGFGVAPRTELTAFQPFFVSLSMPSSVIRGEVFPLKATVFNYLPGCMKVKATLAESQQFSVQVCDTCTYTRCLCADESFTFTWTIKPQALGAVSVNVTAVAVQSSCGNKPVAVPQRGRVDTVINTLLVLAEGTKQTKSYNELICPSGAAVEKNVSLTLPNVYVNGSVTSSVSVLGDLMGRALKNLAGLLAMPGGCGEQNMLQFAPNIFILQYLESSGQLTPDIRSKAETFLISGYQGELTYKHTDGSYSAFGMSDSSGNTWLTAFVMKSFGAAKHYVFIDQQQVDQARAWLGQQQQDNGCFASVGQLFHTDMKGGVNDEATLSAYIAAALLELGVGITDPVVEKSLTCLRNASSHLTSTYAMALLSYTFTLAGDQTMRNSLLTQLDANAVVSGGGRHWSRGNDGTINSLEVEMTSYVLLALLSGPFLPRLDMGYCASIVHWLAQQQNAFGGFASTQDTVVALQALAKYSSATYSPSGSFKVSVTSPSGLRQEFMVNQSNRLLYQESQLQEVPGNYKVKADGKGCVYVQFTVNYNIPPPADSSSFSIAAKTTGKCGPVPAVEVTVTIRYNGKRNRTNMVIIDVKLLSGFNLDESSVQQVNASQTNTGPVKRVDQSEGHAFIYLDGLNKGEERSYSLEITQEEAVQNLKPAVIKVYDYYETGDEAVAQYTSPCV